VSKDSVLVIRIADGYISVAESLPWNDIFGHHLEIKKPWLIDIWFGNDASWRALVYNFRTYGNVSTAKEPPSKLQGETLLP
jgi:hypothetical protein